MTEMQPAPSSITPIPLAHSFLPDAMQPGHCRVCGMPEPGHPHPRLVTGAPRTLGLAGAALGGVAAISALVQGVGGLPEVVRAVTAILAHGWVGAVSLLAVSTWLIHLQQLASVRAEARADREAIDARQAARDQQIVRAVNELLRHAQSEDLAHQRGEAVMREILEEARNQTRLLAEPTAPKPRPEPSADTPKDWPTPSPRGRG